MISSSIIWTSPLLLLLLLLLPLLLSQHFTNHFAVKSSMCLAVPLLYSCYKSLDQYEIYELKQRNQDSICSRCWEQNKNEEEKKWRKNRCLSDSCTVVYFSSFFLFVLFSFQNWANGDGEGGTVKRWKGTVISIWTEQRIFYFCSQYYIRSNGFSISLFLSLRSFSFVPFISIISSSSLRFQLANAFNTLFASFVS